MSIIAALRPYGTVAALIHKPMKRSLFNAGMTGVVAIALSFNLVSCSRPTKSAETTLTPQAAVPEQTQATPTALATPEAAASAASQPAEVAEAAPVGQPETQPASQPAKSAPSLVAPPPAFEVVPSEAKEAAATLTDVPLPPVVQPYSSDELFAAGSGGCGMSLWRAEGSYSDGSILFSGIGEGPQLLMKLDGKFVTLERIEGNGEEFYGQFAQQRFRNLNGDIEVMTEVKLGAEGEIESVEIDSGRVVVTRNKVSQEIAVKGDAGC